MPLLRALVALLVVSGAFAADLAPVPSSSLNGLTLNDALRGFTVAAPSPEWEWLVSAPVGGEGPNGHISYVCRRRGANEQLTVMVFNEGWDALTIENARKQADGVSKGFENNGSTTSLEDLRAVTLPSGDGFRYVVRFTTSQGATGFMYCYAIVKDRLFMLQQVSRDSVEPPVLSELTKSLKISKGGSHRSRPADTLGTFCVTMSFLGLVGGFLAGWLLNLIARRVVVSPSVFAFVGIGLAILAGLALAIQEMSRSVDPNAEAFRQGELVGTVFGSAVLPLLIAFLIQRSYKKRSLASPSMQRSPTGGR